MTAALAPEQRIIHFLNGTVCGKVTTRHLGHKDLATMFNLHI